jgi:hypothetical protein
VADPSARESRNAEFAEIRTKELRRLLLHRYGTQLPDDDAGRDDLYIMLRHLAHLPRGGRRMENFCDLWAPWLPQQERELVIRKTARTRPPRFTADRLAEMLNVTIAERDQLGVTTIGAVDCLKAEREERRRDKARERQARRRRKLGRRTRPEYLQGSLSKLQPWVAEGISKATWYRRRKSGETSPFAATLS